MPKTEVDDWDTTAGNNTDVGGINIGEGMSPANVNNAMREMMAQLKAFAGTFPSLSSNQTVSGVWTFTAMPVIPDQGVVSAKLANLSVTEGKIAADAVTNAKIGTGAVTTAKIQDGAVTAAKVSAELATIARSLNIVALDSNSPTPDMATGFQFSRTWTGNGTVANPTNATAGMSIAIYITQDATGGRTVGFGSNWIFRGTPTIDLTANSVTMVVGSFLTADYIIARIV